MTSDTEPPEGSDPRPNGSGIHLVATTGHPNYGDELIAGAWLRYLARTAPDTPVWVDCPNPGPSDVLLGHLHPNVRFTDTFWRLCWHAPTDEPWGVAAFVKRAMADPGLAPRWVAGIELALRADVVHILGGGYINGIWPRHLGLLGAAVACADLTGAKLAMTGQGLSPIPTETVPLLRDLACRFDVVDLRDGPSADPLRDITDVSTTGDDLFLGVTEELYNDAEAPEIMLCVQSDMLDVSVPGLAGFVSETLRRWGVTSERIGVVEGIPQVDRRVYELLESELPGTRFYPFSEIMRDGLPATAGQTWLSTRFHMHLMAAAAGATGVAVSVNPDYYTNKHRSLIERGSGWALTEGLRVPTKAPHGGFSEAALRELRQAKVELAGRVY